MISRTYVAGTKRIVDKLDENYDGVLEGLDDLIERNVSPLQIGRYLHQNIGEGSAWWWNRLSRSELVLALNDAFYDSAQKYGVPMVRWSASPTACDICLFFDGKVWKIGENPSPVTSSHPHCQCTLESVYVTDESLQTSWTRETPYDEPYTPPERAYFEAFNSQTV
jgi:hypothetical protein